jgi:hypothetical protein
MIHGLAPRTASQRPASSPALAGAPPRRQGPGTLGRHLPDGGAARAVKRRIERGEFDPNAPDLPAEAVDHHKALTLFGDYVTKAWWPRWRDAHPHSAYLYGKRIEKRILPAFGNVRFIDLDADRFADWKAKLVAEGPAAQTINAYLSLLGTILNAAVDSDSLPRSPMRRKSGAGRVFTTPVGDGLCSLRHSEGCRCCSAGRALPRR